jgi:hypothetical protein
VYIYSQFSTNWDVTLTLISISHLSFSPLIPKCIAWNFDGSNFVNGNKENLKKLKFENGDTIPDVESFFTKTTKIC